MSKPSWCFWPTVRNINIHKNKVSGAVPKATRDEHMQHAVLVGSEQPFDLPVSGPLGRHGDCTVCFDSWNVSVRSVFRQTAAAATSLCQMMESQRTEQVFMHKSAAQRFSGDYSVYWPALPPHSLSNTGLLSLLFCFFSVRLSSSRWTKSNDTSLVS